MYKCEHCDRIFQTKSQRGGHQRVHSTKIRSGKEIDVLRRNSEKRHKEIFNKYMENPFKCANCNKIISYEKSIRRRSDLKYRKSKNVFCNMSCRAVYNNTHKTVGIRRSKLEIWLEEKLNKIYPNLEIHYCRKDAINSELDIYIPSLKLGFELNGIYHYEPIHGQQILENIQNNDKRKFQACLEQNIELCIIDSSSLKYFKESNALPYLKIIQNIIECKLPCEDLNRV
jgi:hypothetical protein